MHIAHNSIRYDKLNQINNKNKKEFNFRASQQTVWNNVEKNIHCLVAESPTKSHTDMFEKFNVDLIGGDTTSSISGLTISISVFGKVDKDKITYRSGAKEKDLICVSGDLGAAYIGLQLLEREKRSKKLGGLARKLQLQRNLMGKGSKKKIIIEGEQDNDGEDKVIYKWKKQRQK